MKLNWYTASREKVIAALRRPQPHPNYWSHSPGYVEPGQLSYALSAADESSDQRVCLVLLGNERKEFFSWVATYAEEVFPVSMCARVMHANDWSSLDFEGRQDWLTPQGSDIWSSVVLGELLGQSAGDVDASSAPIGRAPACFSFAVARAALLYPRSTFAVDEGDKRLATIAADARFGKRPIGVGALFPIWSIPRQLSHLFAGDFGSIDALLEVLRAVDASAHDRVVETEILFSDFAENRIEGFDALVNELTHRQFSHEKSSKGVAPALAAAALIAGRGTGHVQLLSPLARDIPEVFAWFGMFAGLLGQSFWDLSWSRTARSVDRLLRRPFRPDEPVQADLCWAEFEWLAQTISSADAFSDLPKIAPRSLLVEVLPGVEFQLRLVTRDSSSENVAAPEPAALSPRVIDEALTFLTAAQGLLRGEGIPSRQSDLFGNKTSGALGRPKAKAGGISKRGKKQM